MEITSCKRWSRSNSGVHPPNTPLYPTLLDPHQERQIEASYSQCTKCGFPPTPAGSEEGRGGDGGCGGGGGPGLDVCSLTRFT